MPSLPVAPLRVALFGAGRVATAVCTLLQRRGHDIVAVASPHERSAAAAASRLGAPVVAPSELEGSDVILIGAPDTAVADAVTRLGRAVSGAVLIHFAGSAGVSVMSAAEGAAARCALHPVQACPDVDAAIGRLPGSAWGVTCSDGARAWARALIENDLEGTPFDVEEADRMVWHAAAVTTSNGISALIAAGELLLSHIGIEEPSRVLGPIVAGTVANVREVGSGADALTGPVVRGEVDVIDRQVAAIRIDAPDLLPAYLAVQRAVVAGALAAGRIDEATAGRIRDTLETT